MKAMRYEMYNGMLCVEGLMDAAGAGVYANLYRSGLRIVRTGGRGRTSLATYDSIREDWRERIADELGDPRQQSGDGGFVSMVQFDHAALTFYEGHILEDGRVIPVDTQIRYANSASILNALRTLELQYIQMGRGGAGYLSICASSMPLLKDMYPHTLPESVRRLKPRYEEYKADGYETLVHGNFGNINARNMTDNVKRLILSIKGMPQKPYDGTVLEIYHEWLSMAYDLCDAKTGELFDRADFMRNGKPVEISLSTVRRYTTDSLNAAAVDRNLMTFHDYNSAHRPHRHRDNNLMSGSFISMDDRDLPRKAKNGKRPKAYYAFDSGSRAVIGYAHSIGKDANLYEECMRNMFRTIQDNGLAMPGEVQVENHLVKEYFPHLRAMFPFVRVCAPTNSQEKLAEHMIKQKKYGSEKKSQNNIGRYNLRNKANVLNVERINDEDIEKMYDYDELIADDIQTIHDHNHTPMKKFGGRTRWQKFIDDQNPALKPFERHTAAFWFGKKSDDKVNVYRNQYVNVAKGKYMLPSSDVMAQLPDAKAMAHWMPEPDGSVGSVYLYRDDRYICECKRIEGYKTARIERTDNDEVLKKIQDKFVSHFDADVKHRNEDLYKIKKQPIVIAETVQTPKLQPVMAVVERHDSVDDMMDDFSPEAMARRALNDC